MGNNAIFFIIGLVLFLFGMLQLSTGIQRMISARIRAYIRYSVRTPFYGLMMGILSTVLLQSSTATTIITVGIVNAGLITFYHSLGIILGADIGTTLTVQLVVWKVTSISPLLIFFGGGLWISGKEKWNKYGEAIFYFGLMFFGLEMTSQAAAPLKENIEFINFLQSTRNPLLGLFAGLVFTALVHASSIPISILVILAQHGLIGIDNALPVVFGANIGTTATVLMAGLAANISGKRTAIAHFLFKLIGVLVAFAVFPIFTHILKNLVSDTAQQIALGHFLFNMLILLLFIFVLGPVSRLLEKIMPGKDETLPLWPEYLDESYLTNPEQALDCVRKELRRQLSLAQRTVQESMELITNYKEYKRKTIFYIELVIDNLQSEIISYVWKVSAGPLSQALSTKLFLYTAMVDDIERIGDHAINLVDLSRHKYRRRISFTGPVKSELMEIGALIRENLSLALQLIEKKDSDKIARILANEDKVDKLVRESLEKHLERFYKRICEAESGPIFVEMLVNLERISDHCENIAQYFQKLD
jgi:phosphate:Na+ symporter